MAVPDPTRAGGPVGAGTAAPSGGRQPGYRRMSEEDRAPGGPAPRDVPVAVPARPAATLLLVRDGRHPVAPLEVLLVRRNAAAEFAGGAFVFPGGAIDLEDGTADAGTGSTGRSDVEASRILGLPSGGLAYWVAALRECFEEAGVLLAYPPGGRTGSGAGTPGPSRSGTGAEVPAAPAGAPVPPGDGAGRPLLSLARPGDAERFALHRREVNAGHRRFLDACREEGVLLALDRVHYFAHWVTPPGGSRRYDTRFFVAAAPPGQVATDDAAETVATRWLRPAAALAAHREGRLELIFPTIRNLEAVGRFPTTAELLAAASAASTAGDGTAISPRTVPDGNGVRILLPGDPGGEALPDAHLDGDGDGAGEGG